MSVGGAVTVIVAVDVTDTPSALVAFNVYDVVTVGEYVPEPFGPTVVGIAVPACIVTDTAFVVVQDNVAVCPAWIVIDAGLSDAVGSGAGTFTETVAFAVADTPEALVAIKVYGVVTVGLTDWEPLAPTVAPFNVTETALVVLHVSIDDWPLMIVVGFADSVAVGAGSTVGADTDTLATAVAETPAEFRATNV